MTSATRVSVVVPVRDGARFLADALASVLAQSRAPYEVIVVDDGSRDASAAIAERFGRPVRVIRQINAGPPAARNRGVREAKGDAVAFLDHDDLWTLDKLAIQAGVLDRDAATHLVLGRTQTLVQDGPASALTGEPWPAMSLGAALIRRAAFDRVGPLDEARRFDDDVDWFLRAKEAGLRAHLHADLVQHYRRHEGNLTNDRAQDRHAFLGALRDSIARRRLAGAATQRLPAWDARPRG